MLSVINFLMLAPCAFFAMKASQFLLSFGKGRLRKVILFAAYWMLISMIIYIGDPYNLPPTVLLFMTAAFICYQGPPLQKCTVSLMFVSTALAFNALLDNLADPHAPFRVAVKLCFWALFYLMMRRFAPPKGYELSSSLWRLLLLLTTTPIGITCALVLLVNPFYTMNNAVKYAFIACLFIAFISFIGLSWAITVLAKQQRLERDSLMAEMNKRYYESMEQQQFEVRRLRHDLANHLQILASLPADEKDSYLAELIKSPAMANTLHYCGDSTINAVLSAKIPAVEQEDIRLEVKADVADELPFEQVDICALLANAIDNAIEACLKLPPDSRRIDLKLRAQKGVFAVSTTNPLPEDASPGGPGGLPQTSKKNRNDHGYGLKSIREIVARYNGNMEVKTEEQKFQLFLYMPADGV